MEAARTLLPPGFEELADPMYMVDAVYAACRQVGIDVGGLGATLPLAVCHACVRAQAALLGPDG